MPADVTIMPTPKDQGQESMPMWSQGVVATAPVKTTSIIMTIMGIISLKLALGMDLEIMTLILQRLRLMVSTSPHLSTLWKYGYCIYIKLYVYVYMHAFHYIIMMHIGREIYCGTPPLNLTFLSPRCYNFPVLSAFPSSSLGLSLCSILFSALLFRNLFGFQISSQF